MLRIEPLSWDILAPLQLHLLINRLCSGRTKHRFHNSGAYDSWHVEKAPPVQPDEASDDFWKAIAVVSEVLIGSISHWVAVCDAVAEGAPSTLKFRTAADTLSGEIPKKKKKKMEKMSGNIPSVAHGVHTQFKETETCLAQHAPH